METYVDISADFSSRMLFFKQALPCFLNKRAKKFLGHLRESDSFAIFLNRLSSN